MEKTIELLNMLKGSTQVEFNDLNTVLKWNEVEGRRNIYFVAGLKEKLSKRCLDDDIFMKKYFVVDIDIRLDCYKMTGIVLDNDQLMEHMSKVLECLSDSKLDDYSAIVHSGNGIHLYYVGEEREFDKEMYSHGVQMIYEKINNAIKSTGYKCDQACHNISRIMRLPGTINPRRKELVVLDEKGNRVRDGEGNLVKELAYDLGDFTCYVMDIEPKNSILFQEIELYAKQYENELEKEREDSKRVHQIIKSDYKSSADSDVRSEINRIPACDIAEDIRPITVSDKGKDNVALKESDKNMGAYWYRPTNVIVNTGSSLIKTNKSYFTSYELVFYEYANQDAKRTLEYFKKRGINLTETKSGLVIPKKEYQAQGYVYPGPVFDPFDCVMSGELMTIVALSNSGKTSYAMDMIQENVKLGKKCFYINLEFPIETVWKSRWLWLNKYSKKNLTDLAPLSQEAKDQMNDYVSAQLAKFDSFSDAKGIELEDLVNLIVEKNKEGYGFFVVDTFSRIKGNLDSRTSHTNQNKCMETLQELCQSIGVVVVLLHHTNKAGGFEGSQKIMDLSNVFLIMSRINDDYLGSTTKFSLTKDKFISYTEIETTYHQGKYELVA